MLICCVNELEHWFILWFLKILLTSHLFFRFPSDFACELWSIVENIWKHGNIPLGFLKRSQVYSWASVWSQVRLIRSWFCVNFEFSLECNFNEGTNLAFQMHLTSFVHFYMEMFELGSVNTFQFISSSDSQLHWAWVHVCLFFGNLFLATSTSFDALKPIKHNDLHGNNAQHHKSSTMA